MSARDAKLKELASAHGFDIDAEIKVGGSYVSLLRHGSQVFISGQIPRVGDKVVVTGKLGAAARARFERDLTPDAVTTRLLESYARVSGRS